MSISSIGVGSGLPLASLLDDLRSSKQAQLDAISARQTKAESRVSAYGQLKSELENLSKAALALNEKALDAVKASVTGSDFTATAKAGAIPSNYEISVTSLAKAQSLVMQGTASRTENLSTGGVIKFTVNGEERSLDMTGKNTSLNDIVAAINADSSLGLSASVVNNGGTNPYQLVLTSRTTGTDAAVTKIEVSGEGTDQLRDLMSFGVAGSTVTENAASNAQATINGIAVTSQTNTLSNTIDGVSLVLTGQSGAAGTLKVEKDTDAIVASIENYVNTYNDVQKKIKQLTNYDTATNTGAALVGDSIPRSIQSRLASVLNTTVEGTEFPNLSFIGIRTGEGGLLTVDKTKLTDAINSNPDGVKKLFQGDNGIAKVSIDTAKIFTDSTDGLLAKSTEGANRAVKSIKDEYDRASLRIDAEMELMRKQFTAMDSLVAQMNSMSAQLSQQLASLSSGTK